MNLLPKASGNRPRLACEIFPGGVVAGRSPEPGAPLMATAKVATAENAVVPGLKPGNVPDRVAVIAAVRRALEQVGGRSNARNADLTLIIPDAAVRVLLLDFDTLPTKLSEALPIVRFRLKKLVPFDSDEAMVSFQVLSSTRSMVRVLAVAMPRDVLAEYETLAREAGFEPGAVLPSTLAALASLDEGEGASLVVNAHALGVTTAIVRAGILLLHRAVELTEFAAPVPAGLPAALFENTGSGNGALLPLVDRDLSQAEWAAQEALPEHGRNPYADRAATEVVTQNEDAITGMQIPAGIFLSEARDEGYPGRGQATFDMYAAEAAPVARSPYASSMLQEQLSTQFDDLASAPSFETEADEFPAPFRGSPQEGSGQTMDSETPIHTLAPDAQAEEIARAVSVAIAYFEDSLSAAPETLLSAGPLGAEALHRMLQEQGVAGEDGVRVRELVDPAALASTATSASVPRGWLAGIVGALKS
ncbi:MAG TPA: hypothetical protein VKV02_13685 [Acidobacteriaceae bacterium]|nr:hypothetical protein [Acidobacteriaceae bacterium]